MPPVQGNLVDEVTKSRSTEQEGGMTRAGEALDEWPESLSIPVVLVAYGADVLETGKLNSRRGRMSVTRLRAGFLKSVSWAQAELMGVQNMQLKF